MITGAPKSAAERVKWLTEDARRILAAPEKHSDEEVRWAEDWFAALERENN